MSNYTVSTNFGAKDALPSGNPAKLILGAQLTTEFTNIATAIATKLDAAGAGSFSSVVSNNSGNTLIGLQNQSNGTLASVTSTLSNDASNTLAMSLTSSGFSGSFFSGAPAGQAALVYTTGLVPLVLGTNSVARLTIGTTGGFQVGAPTGGDKGVGTLNATQLYVAGTPLFQVGTFTGTFTGMTAGTTGTVNYSIVGNVATLDFETITGTSNTTAMTMTGLPAALQPATMNPFLACNLEDSGLNVEGCAQVTANSGTITFFRGVVSGTALTHSATGFTASGVKGVNRTTLTYLLT